MDGPWQGVGPGTLVDEEINMLAANGELITRDFDASRVRQACYELRASEILYDVAEAEEKRRVLLAAGQSFVLKPHRYVTCIVMESIRLPPNVLGRILTKGQLFSIGILPVNTYADPGFEGRLGITLVNASQRYVVIRPGQPIAKIEFVVLSKPVRNPYAGQHGYETEIWPIPAQHYGDLEDLKSRHLIGDDIDEIAASYGPRLADVARRLRYYSRTVWIQLAVTILLFLALAALHGQVGLIQSVGVGIVANLVTSFGIYIVQRGRRI